MKAHQQKVYKSERQVFQLNNLLLRVFDNPPPGPGFQPEKSQGRVSSKNRQVLYFNTTCNPPAGLEHVIP